ncbi:CBS domain-containing protein [Fervidicoccus fontis]|uniref:FOG CBS domain protein n=1 Tax=Fervidicoccus fontis (strain DSM 19380 / JCM 18336 / VKM B-2539 / Kam940) TaxID=1163730 RepID=H9ZZY0_FERFK|nr:CBS domain-containing protein [Fervidicoccus fontis]AFH42287.1 FOG CBS domain protein [Fervidicoccus fontis Kam940]
MISIPVGKVKAENILKKFPYLLPYDKASHARELIREYKIRVLAVANSPNNPKIVGLIKRVNILNISSTKSNLQVNDIMEQPIAIIREDDEVDVILNALLKNNEWYGIVTNSSGEYKGIVGLEDVINYYYKNEPEIFNVEASVLSKKLEYLYEDDEISKAWYKMLEHDYAGFPVVKRDLKVVGSLTQHDLISKGYTRIQLESQTSPRKILVKEAMNVPPICIKQSDKVTNAVDEMVNKNVGRVFIIDDGGKIKGIIDRSDIARLIFEKKIKS